MRLTWLALCGLLFGCSASSPAAPAARPPRADGPAELGAWDLTVDADALTATLTPVDRRTTALGDEVLLDLGATLKPLCRDCFQPISVGRSPDNHVEIDFALRHPFPTTFPRKQYDVFDVRAILLVGIGDAVFSNTPPGPNGLIATDATIMPNADGYTPFYTERNPSVFRATINPYKAFFVEDNPDPAIEGAAIPDHRMTYGGLDVRRIEINPPVNPYKLRMVLQAQYIEAGNKSITPGNPGSETNPLFFLPEGHEDEAYDVAIAFTGLPLSTSEVRPLGVTVTSRDWQAGATVDAGFPNLANPTGLDGSTSNIANVSLEIPVLDYFSGLPLTSGSGTAADPRIDTWNFDTGPVTAGEFPVLVTIEDERQPTDFTGLTSLSERRAFRIAWITIEP
ncbi:MAG: hypothetical protein ABI743_14030 [bacterium]